LLSALDTSRWFPQSSDVYGLYEELARLKGDDPTLFSPKVQQRLSALDNHHPLPQEFTPQFKSVGIDPEDYKMFMDAGPHRLLSRKPYLYQTQWARYLGENKGKLTQEDIIK